MIALIAAISSNRAIGKDGKLPWHISEDLARFRELTNSKAVIMGRKTWESLPERFRPLPGRQNIVLSRSGQTFAGAQTASSLDEAIALAENKEIFIIGGAEVYQKAIHRADRLYITEIKKEFAGDVFFPEIDRTIWREKDRLNRGEFDFVTYDKVS